MFTLSNSTRPEDAVRNLNLWIYYPNVTEWWSQNLWHRVPPTPQDYEACEDSAFPCEKRVTLISSADADGVVEFSKIPGPRFMNTTWKYVFSANHSDVTWLRDLVATQFVLNNDLRRRAAQDGHDQQDNRPDHAERREAGQRRAADVEG
jgi:hypothetical protein